MVHKRLAVALVLGSVAAAAVAVVAYAVAPGPAGRDAAAPVPAPKPELTPEQVIRTVLDALKDNDRPRPDAGIATAFAFASTANKQATGPLDRFVRMVKGPAYRTMIGYKSAEYRPMAVRGDAAFQQVKLVGAGGETVEYGFGLSRDPETNCWMTDAVVIIPPPPAPPRNNNEA